MSEGIRRRTFLQGSAVTAGMLALPATAEAAASPRVERTTVEYAPHLLGTDVTAPQLSWIVDPAGDSTRQTAYQVRVDGVWDSGKVASARTVNVAYGGPPLAPHTRYTWRVRFWDERGRVSGWSPASWWETGFLGNPWQAEWIGAPPVAAPPDFAGAGWIWSAGATPTDAPAGPRWFRRTTTLPADTSSAVLIATADDDFTLYVNGARALHAPERVDGWKTGQLTDVSARGEITLAAVATNRGNAAINPGGLLVKLVVTKADGTQQEIVTDAGWKVADTEQDGWQRPGFDDSGWAPANVLAPYGQGPWGSQVGIAQDRAAPVLRRQFTVDKPVRAARLYLAGLAYYDAELNGRHVGGQVLDPGFTDYDQTVLYATHDVTTLLSRGDNEIAVTLGRGFYGMTTPNVWNWHRASWHGEPRLLAQLVVTHTDNTSTVVGTDPDWQVADSPTRSDSLYAGETYDARVIPEWRQVAKLDAPLGTLTAQQHEPVVVAETVTPVSITPVGESYVADMGRTMAGWTKLTVTAGAGTVIRLQHGEKLNADGSVQGGNGHVPGRHQLDEYVCAGTGAETWEPRFSYKGFRYVQVTGLPEAPRPEDLQGRVVHSDVPDTGSFSCSEPLYEQFERAMRRTVRNNLHGIPTDTPMYEKNGWTGDAQLGVPIMAYSLGMARFLTKWLGDLADSQNDAGQLPVIVPSGGWGYQELAPAPEWTTVYPFVLREMYRVYGDEQVAATHWPTLVKYLDWEIARLQNGLAVTALGDYLPPGYGGNPPEDTRLTATAFLHRALTVTAELGDLIGRQDVAARYRQVAAGLKDALNAEFLRGGAYRTDRDPDYRQTSNAVPLAFGLVPPDAVADVVANLVADVRARGNHLNTGALGTNELLPVLTAHGHADLAHAVATQRTYPSWGFWFSRGAETMWEMWHEGSRSRDHYFQGTVVRWLYENVAGLRPGDAGYQRFVVWPDATTGVTWARTSIDTVRGRAAVDWSRQGDTFTLDVEVPFGSTAEVHEPNGRVRDVGPGQWRFRSRIG